MKRKINTLKPTAFYWNNNRSSINTNIFMFAQDLGNGISFLDSDDRNIKITLTSNKKSIRKVVNDLFATQDYTDVEDSVIDFIEHTGNIIGWYGEAFYELVIEGQEVRLFNVSNHTLHKVPFGYVQILPEDLRKRNNLKSKFHFIMGSKIIRFSYPKELGGIRHFKQMTKNLKRATSETLYKNIIPHYKENPSMFDLEHFKYQQELVIAKNTFDLGWYARGMYMNRLSEYNQLQMTINFKKNMSVIRFSLIAQMNELLSKVGAKLNFDTEIKTEGMQMPEYYENLKKELKEGVKSIEEVRNILFPEYKNLT